MKKFLILITALSLLLCCAGCGEAPAEVVLVTEAPTVEATVVPTAEPAMATEEPEALRYEVNSGEAWGDYGYVHFLCQQSGTYSFKAVDSEGIDWKIYLLDAEFNDAERFIPQAYECALEGDGTLDIAQGQYIYIYSSANNWTGIEARDSAYMECSLIYN